jgi:hypothetical protein
MARPPGFAGGHGNFPRAEQLRAVAAVRAYLARHGIARQPVTSSASVRAQLRAGENQPRGSAP